MYRLVNIDGTSLCYKNIYINKYLNTVCTVVPSVPPIFFKKIFFLISGLYTVYRYKKSATRGPRSPYPYGFPRKSDAQLPNDEGVTAYGKR